jgi:hypothetical protein
MDMKRISIVSGTALLALTATASAGPMSVSSSQIITPPTQIEQAHYYYRHHYRHYGWHPGWHRGWHYGWHRGWHTHYYGYGYGYGYPYNYGYGYGAGLAALATAPLALAAGVTAPLMTGRSVAASGNYCATPVKTCLLYEPGWVGTGCSCKVYDGYARGTVE